MNLAFGRAGVADEVTSESHAAQLARAREAGDAKEEERLLLNPPSAHIGPAAKHRWEERSPAQMPDRVVEYEAASAAAREARLAHARDAAEAAEARREVEKLDAEIAALEAEQRRADEAARRRKEAAARREAERRRDEAKWDEKNKAREIALRRVPGGVELYLAHLADLDPKWNVNGNSSTTYANIDAALGAAESDDTRLGRLRDVLSDEVAAARYREEFDRTRPVHDSGHRPRPRGGRARSGRAAPGGHRKARLSPGAAAERPWGRRGVHRGPRRAGSVVAADRNSPERHRPRARCCRARP